MFWLTACIVGVSRIEEAETTAWFVLNVLGVVVAAGLTVDAIVRSALLRWAHVALDYNAKKESSNPRETDG